MIVRLVKSVSKYRNTQVSFRKSIKSLIKSNESLTFSVIVKS
jgi:hypothetical protein